MAGMHEQNAVDEEGTATAACCQLSLRQPRSPRRVEHRLAARDPRGGGVSPRARARAPRARLRALTRASTRRRTRARHRRGPAAQARDRGARRGGARRARRERARRDGGRGQGRGARPARSARRAARAARGRDRRCGAMGGGRGARADPRPAPQRRRDEAAAANLPHTSKAAVPVGLRNLQRDHGAHQSEAVFRLFGLFPVPPNNPDDRARRRAASHKTCAGGAYGRARAGRARALGRACVPRARAHRVVLAAEHAERCARGRPSSARASTSAAEAAPRCCATAARARRARSRRTGRAARGVAHRHALLAGVPPLPVAGGVPPPGRRPARGRARRRARRRRDRRGRRGRRARRRPYSGLGERAACSAPHDGAPLSTVDYAGPTWPRRARRRRPARPTARGSARGSSRRSALAGPAVTVMAPADWMGGQTFAPSPVA